MKKTILVAAAVGVLALAGTALAASVNNYFQQATPGTKNNVLVLNGTVKVEDVTLPVAATFTEGTESSDKFDVAIDFLDGNGTAIAKPFQTYCWASESSAGAGYVTTAGTSAFSAVTDGSIESVTSGQSANAITTATGEITIRVTQTSATAPSQYLCCTSGVGIPLCSDALDWS